MTPALVALAFGANSENVTGVLYVSANFLETELAPSCFGRWENLSTYLLRESISATGLGRLLLAMGSCCKFGRGRADLNREVLICPFCSPEFNVVVI